MLKIDELPAEGEALSVSVADAVVTLRREKGGGLAIDRIFVEPHQRRQGKAEEAIKQLVQWAQKDKVILSAIVSPDDDSTADGLIRAFLRAGFESEEFDGEVYYDNLLYQPLKPQHDNVRSTEPDLSP